MRAELVEAPAAGVPFDGEGRTHSGRLNGQCPSLVAEAREPKPGRAGTSIRPWAIRSRSLNSGSSHSKCSTHGSRAIGRGEVQVDLHREVRREAAGPPGRPSAVICRNGVMPPTRGASGWMKSDGADADELARARRSW